jgi:glycosyltransferase involved in cell wall biosynthesis
MPTRDRRRFVPLAVSYFLRQDYSRRELIIVDDGDDGVADLVPQDPRVRYLRLERKITLGAKRNLACDEAAGEVIIHWDDDDWMSPWRISYQAARLINNRADLCGLDKTIYYDVSTQLAWEHIFLQSRRRPWVTGGTLCYTKTFWSRNPFLDISIGEDTRFQWTEGSKRVITLQDPTCYVALIHPWNTSPKQPGKDWYSYPVNAVKKLFGEDWQAYGRILRENFSLRKENQQSEQTGSHNTSISLVSIVFPTYNRRPFFEQAIRYYLRQDYPHTEFIILDDGTETVNDLVPDDPRIRYVRLDKKYSLGTKRNIGCSLSNGEIVIFWDDDDWYGPTRITHQVSPILENRADITCLGDCLFFSIDSRKFWSCTPALYGKMFAYGVAGGTMAFKKSVWTKSGRFPDSSLAEEATFLRDVVPQGCRLERLSSDGVFFYVRHGNNSWQFDVGDYLDSCGWSQVPPPPFIPQDDLSYYGITN